MVLSVSASSFTFRGSSHKILHLFVYQGLVNALREKCLEKLKDNADNKRPKAGAMHDLGTLGGLESEARGINHSNQIRELTLDDNGPGLADVYIASGQMFGPDQPVILQCLELPELPRALLP